MRPRPKPGDRPGQLPRHDGAPGSDGGWDSSVAQTGRPGCRQPNPAFIPLPVMAFSPSGKWFACSTINRFYVFDTASGALHREITTGVNPFGNFAWTSDKHLLVGGGALFDIDLQFRVWDYKG